MILPTATLFFSRNAREESGTVVSRVISAGLSNEINCLEARTAEFLAFYPAALTFVAAIFGFASVALLFVSLKTILSLSLSYFHLLH